VSFIVTLTEVCTIPWKIIQSFYEEKKMETRQIEIVRQCLDIVMKSSAITTMLPVGRSPRQFYFPLDKQVAVLRGKRTTALQSFQDQVYFYFVTDLYICHFLFSHKLCMHYILSTFKSLQQRPLSLVFHRRFASHKPGTHLQSLITV
jgi:hypothetical protein